MGHTRIIIESLELLECNSGYLEFSNLPLSMVWNVSVDDAKSLQLETDLIQ